MKQERAELKPSLFRGWRSSKIIPQKDYPQSQSPSNFVCSASCPASQPIPSLAVAAAVLASIDLSRGALRPKASTNWHSTAKASPSLLNGPASEIHVGVSNLCPSARRNSARGPPPLSSIEYQVLLLGKRPPNRQFPTGPAKRQLAEVSDVNGSFKQEAATKLE